jgi:hypothetical protein
VEFPSHFIFFVPLLPLQLFFYRILPPSTMRIAMPVNIITAPLLVIVILLSIIRSCESSDDGE